MSLKYIRKAYDVPAKRGGRVLFRHMDGGGKSKGTITGSYGQYLRVRLDHSDLARPLKLHPTWNVEYTTDGKTDAPQPEKTLWHDGPTPPTKGASE